MNTRVVFFGWIFLLLLLLANKMFGKDVSSSFQSMFYLALSVVAVAWIIFTVLGFLRHKRNIFDELDQVEQTMRKEESDKTR